MRSKGPAFIIPKVKWLKGRRARLGFLSWSERGDGVEGAVGGWMMGGHRIVEKFGSGQRFDTFSFVAMELGWGFVRLRSIGWRLLFGVFKTAGYDWRWLEKQF